MSKFNYKKAILHGDGSIESFAVANVGTDRQEYDREDHSAEVVLKDILAKLTPRQKEILRGREAWIGYISDDGAPSMQPTLHVKTRSMESKSSWWEFVPADREFKEWTNRVERVGEDTAFTEELTLGQNRKVAKNYKNAVKVLQRRIAYLEELKDQGRFKNRFEENELKGLQTSLGVLTRFTTDGQWRWSIIEALRTSRHWGAENE